MSSLLVSIIIARDRTPAVAPSIFVSILLSALMVEPSFVDERKNTAGPTAIASVRTNSAVS